MQTLLESIPRLPKRVDLSWGSDVVVGINEKVAALAGRYLALSTYLDDSRNRLASTLLRADHRVVARMLVNVRQPQARRDAIKAAGMVLPDHARGIFTRMLKRIQEHEDVRNHLAHDSWVACSRYPHDLVVVDPEHLALARATALEESAGGAPWAAMMFDTSVCLLFKRSMLKHLIALACECFETSYELVEWLRRGGRTDDEAHERLLKALPEQHSRPSARKQQRTRKPRQ